MNLTRFGIWTSYRTIGIENAVQAARLAQDLGYGAFWLGGSPEADELRPLLEATETLVAATGITNIWVSDPAVVVMPSRSIMLLTANGAPESAGAISPLDLSLFFTGVDVQSAALK